MQKGFNSDVNVKGRTYHVQTEDWGAEKAYIMSRIFLNGAVVKSIKTPYEVIYSRGPVNGGEAIRVALKNQHHQILDQLISGQLA